MPMLELSTNLLAEIGGWPAMKEARVLVERGKVSNAQRDGATIRARVQGAEKNYDAQITLADRVAAIEVRCTCVESRRSGRVCAHALAAGLAILQPTSAAPIKKAVVPASAPLVKSGSKRWLLEEAPAGIPRVEITVLLPMQLKESLAKDPVRIILEARLEGEDQAQPWDAIVFRLGDGFAVGEEDERLLAALEQTTGNINGINAIPRPKMGGFLRVLAEHPRVWLGKKQRIEVHASDERPRLTLRTRSDGALELIFHGGTAS
ncbi:MAG TPA: hypothetical protein VGC39_10270, partial [Candidatus Methylacidiphilales bacterium]